MSTEAESKTRHRNVAERTSGVLRAVVDRHRPGMHHCYGCDQSPGYQDEAAAWPCSTFLMIEADLPAVETS